jgi:MoxR-like ATPase
VAEPYGALPLADVHALCDRLLRQVSGRVIGQEGAAAQVLAAFLAHGHVLLEDVPGLGKTLLARTFADLLGLRFRRLQCTPDLLPGDVTGGYVYSPGTGGLEFRAGPVFAGILLADEINRATPKAQSALLEAMQERQVTIESETFALPRPFLVIATSNPIESEGTFPLPEAQLDRFLVRLALGFPGREQESEVIRARLADGDDPPPLAPMLDPRRVAAAQLAVTQVEVDPDVVSYCADLARATRQSPLVEVGASTRAAVGLATMARAYAVVRGRDHVLPEDVKQVAVPVLAHRLVLSAEGWARRTSRGDLVEGLLRQVPAPPTRPLRRTAGTGAGAA